jgi:hypothetical protein
MLVISNKKKGYDFFFPLPNRMSSKNLGFKKIKVLPPWSEEILLLEKNHTYKMFWVCSGAWPQNTGMKYSLLNTKKN